MNIGDAVTITIRPGQDEEGTITAIGPVPANGDYPIYTVDVPAYGTFTRPSDEVLVNVTIRLYTRMYACDDFNENAADVAREVERTFGAKMDDWEVVQG
jgi:hypothetical protein